MENEILVEFRKKFGDESILTLSSDNVGSHVRNWLSTGNIAIDRAISGGKGLPSGRMVEIFGDFASGKTLLAMHIIAETQKRGGIGAVLDTERTFESDLATKIGVNVDEVLYLDPESIEDVFEQTDNLVEIVRKKYPEKILSVFWDSVAGTPSRFETKNEYGKPEMAMRARIISSALRKFIPKMCKYNVFLVFVNQIRDSMADFGPPSTTPGGKAIKFHASVRLELKAGKKIIQEGKESGAVIGREGSIKVVKNKVFPPFREAVFQIYYDRGIPSYAGLAKSLLDDDIIKQSGGWYTWKNEKFRGSDIESFLIGNKELAAEAGLIANEIVKVKGEENGHV